MKEMKRILALVLCFVMLVGMMPAVALNADAADTTQYLFFATDRHQNTSIIDTLLDQMSSVGTVEYACLGGDMMNNQNVYSTSVVLAEVASGRDQLTAANVDIVAGNHDEGCTDDAGIFNEYSGYLYSGEDYHVYGVAWADVEKGSTTAQAAAQAFAEWGSAQNDGKVIIVMSHMPLHAKRNDNTYAYLWHEALNAVAADESGNIVRDVIFLHGHNHTDEKTNYAYSVGQGFNVEGAGSVTNYYTYGTAGYLNANKEATLIAVNDSTVTLTRYGSNSTEVYATVTRVADSTDSGDSGSTDETTAPMETTVPVEEKEVSHILAEGTTAYTVGDELTFQVYVEYTDGTYEYVDQAACEITCTCSSHTTCADVAAAMQTVAAGTDNDSHQVKVTYGGKEDYYEFTVGAAESLTGEAEGVVVSVSSGVVSSITAVTSANTNVAAAMANAGVENYAAYDITPTVALKAGNYATVKLPLPEGATNAVVYYISDDGTIVTDMNAKIVDGKAVFTTNHFSTYVVGAAATTGGTATVPGNSSTTTQDKTVYVLTDTIAAGDEVLIVSANSSSGYILGSDTDADNTVSILSGNLTVNGTTSDYTYIENYGSGLVWTVGNGYTFTSGSYKLGVTKTSYGSYYTSYGLTTSASASNASYNWTYSNNTLEDNTNSRYAYYYRRYNDNYSSWTLSEDSQNVYIYKKVTATESTTTGTQEATYGVNITVNGTAASTMEAQNVVNGDTLQLGAEFTSTVAGQEPSGGTWNITSSNTGVATVDNNGLVTFTGVAGETVIRAEYTWTVDGVSYTIYNTLTITTTAMSYTMDIVESEATIKIGATQTLTLETKDSEDKAVTASDVKWTSSAEDIATVENGVVSGVAAGDATITAEWTDPAGVKRTDTAVISVVDAVYTLTIDQGETYIHKGVQAGQTLNLTATVKRDEVAVENPTLTWSIESGSGATIDASTGVLTFDGTEGELNVKVSYVVNDTTTLEKFITVHIHKSTAITPEESTTDFPRWPNEGAVRFDKNAQAVGNFSNTGVAQMELSMAGIPQKTGGAIDVVLMLDMTGSMSDAAMLAAEEAAKTFADQIIKNTDGTFNDSRISVQVFNKNGVTELWELSAVTDETYDSLITAIESASTKQASGGTPYSTALSGCKDILDAAKTDGIGDNRKQFCVFVSDGGPTSYTYITNYDAVKAGTASAYSTSTASASGGSNQSDSNFATIATYTHEYYSTLMKDDGVTMYSVLTGLVAEDYPNCTTIMQNIASDAEKAYVVEDGTDTSALTDAFQTIASEIRAAASQIDVTDKITDSYEMIFKWPEAVKDTDKVAGQEFYIEVVNYELNSTTHERTGTYDVLTRIYLTENADGTLAIDRLVKIEDGTTTNLSQTPVYTAVGEDEKGFFNLVEDEYVYVADGSGAYKMTEGATISGTADTVVLHTPYFSYDASTKVIKWHVSETTENAEIALRYFLYLTNSLESAAGSIDENSPDYVAAGTYPTNDYATLEYTNYKGNECMQYFPEPQLTWNGAQVSYVFYLVNEAGQPVNRAGRVVTFAESVFVTKVHTESVVWNEEEGTTSLDATRIADDLLPDDYTLYDSTTQYEIHVYQNENGEDIYNYFIITAGNGTTMVYNTKAGTKYSTPGEYTSKMDEMNGFDFANTTVAFAVVWERKLVPDTVVVDFGLPVDINVTTNDFVYNAITAIGTNTPNADINTGLYDVSTLNAKADESTHMSGVLPVGEHSAQVINENVIRFTPGSMEFNAPVTFNYETMTDYYEESAVKQAYMYSSVTVIPATTIYYEDEFVDLKTYTNPVTVENEDGTTTTTYTESNGWTTAGTTANATQAQDRPGESQITDALDADNNYGYDAAYSAMSKYSLGSAAMVNVTTGKYATATFTFYGTGFDVISMTSNTTGTLTVKIVDANGESVKNMVVDTYYGYTTEQHKIVYTYTNGEWVAKDEGVVEGATATAKPENPEEGATYTAIEQVWVATPDTANALYQVPVIKAEGLTYGKYTVTITASYVKLFDHTTPAGYDLYLDAIRIYDPANDGANNKVVEDAYKADGEGWPSYIELRNKLIDAKTFNQATNAVTGEVFIDGDATVGNAQIDDYTSYGPNNELYLASGQSIAFQLGNLNKVAKIQLGIKSADGKAVTYTIQNIASDGTVSNAKTATISTATDMYYDITGWKDGIIVITNSGNSGIISLTNIKATYTENPNAAVVTSEEGTDDVASETNEVYTYMTPAAATLTLRALNRPAVVEPEETEPETTEPETTEPETTEPETTEPETTEPETTEPETTEPENTEPEVTEPEEDPSVGQVVKEIVKGIVNVLGKLFSRWF